jgi:esterase/lipase superfamily enzyme
MPAPGAAAGRRQQILQGAQKLFAEKGFRETNLGDVATQRGFRRQAVHHYLPSNDDILNAAKGFCGSFWAADLRVSHVCRWSQFVCASMLFDWVARASRDRGRLGTR